MSDSLSKPGSKPDDKKMSKSGTFGDSNRPKNGLSLGSSSGKFNDNSNASAVRKEKTITLGRVGGDGSYSSSNSVDKYGNKPVTASNGVDQQNDLASKSAPDLWRQPQQEQQLHGDDNSSINKMQYGDENDIDIIYEECTPERLLVKNSILFCTMTLIYQSIINNQWALLGN